MFIIGMNLDATRKRWRCVRLDNLCKYQFKESLAIFAEPIGTLKKDAISIPIKYHLCDVPLQVFVDCLTQFFERNHR